MNPRIRELAEQAQEYVDRSNAKNLRKVFEKKFAELIVQECAGVCESATQPGQPLHLVSLGYSQRVKDHFGVE